MATSQLGGASVTEAVPLAPLTTLRIGPVARRLITGEQMMIAHVYLTILNFLNRHVGLPPVDPDGAGADD